MLKRSLLRTWEADAARAGREFVQPVELGTDEMRHVHPQWFKLLRQEDHTAAFYTTRDCRQWVDESVPYVTTPHPDDPGKGGSKPVLFDVQLNDPKRGRSLLEQFQQAEYPLRVAYAGDPVALSQLNALDRYAQMQAELGGGRFAANPENSDPGILATAEMIDRNRLAPTEIYRSIGTVENPRHELVYRSSPEEQGPGRPSPTAAVLRRQWELPWSREPTATFADRARGLMRRLEPRWYPELAKAVRSAQPYAHQGVDLRPLLKDLDRARPRAEATRRAEPHRLTPVRCPVGQKNRDTGAWCCREVTRCRVTMSAR
ncbi:MAG: hypothetical protein GEV07_25620 [Streptosporangiales bacterium]|nr:hypothetical protein [Streptosporangiales bacterium]